MEVILEHLVVITGNTYLFFSLTFLLLLFLGEPFVLGVAFFSTTHSIFSLPEILVLAYTSALIGELFWFSIARKPFFDFIASKKTYQEVEKLTHLSRMNTPLRLLFFTRFITGLTIVAIVYLSKKGVSYPTFIKNVLLINLFWTPLVVGIGYSAGKGYTLALHIFEDAKFAITCTILLLIGIYLVYRFIGKKLTSPSNSFFDKKDGSSNR